ncbi:Tetratricopeptide repeat protein 1 [Tripterygium wilfordii]|uniref:Tetratricopeptide repeat protein 1 n=1 Tax=Tripterygium wilfordii TaxID=458696 RepID=A0A7J7DT92_TRIWF|nr:Tetratricopeptide repeat protein 1 [Tripterygium wilfordii]
MGKQSGKKKKQGGGQSSDNNAKQTNVGDNSPKAYDKDTTVFISMSQELKEEGNKLFQKRDLEGAMLKYDKAMKLLPRNHIDVSYLRSNLATCYMQMGVSEYPRAIHECNLALEVTPKYSKALLKRARCYEALNRLDLALRDATAVVNVEPNNVMALEIAERIKKTLENKGLRVNDAIIELPPEYVEPPSASPMPKAAKEKARKKKKSKKVEDKQASDMIEEKRVDEKIEETKAEDKVVVEERISITKDEEPKKTVKLVFGEDIRWAQLPCNCSLLQVREVIRDRFPSSRAVLIKYRDQEGDLVTITTDEELRCAEATAESHGSVRLYIVEVNPMQDMFSERFMPEVHQLDIKKSNGAENGNVGKGKGTENGESVIEQIKTGYDWARNEYTKAGQRYEEALKIKPDFYEGFLALGQQQFEQAKLSWYYAISSNANLETWPSSEVLQLYNSAEENMERGMQMWEELEGLRWSELAKLKNLKSQSEIMGLDDLFRDISAEEAAEQASNMSSQINLFWGTILYERSLMEFKLGIPVWEECLEVAVEKFELAGASATDIAVMIKNHYSNNNALEGLSFKIDEIIQAWNEMYEAKKFHSHVRSFRLEALLRRRVPKFYHALEHV